MAGKGDKLRKGANMQAFWDNYDGIFCKKSTKLLPAEYKTEHTNHEKQPTPQPTTKTE